MSNIIKLDNFRKELPEDIDFIDDPVEYLEEPIVKGWSNEGEHAGLYIASTVDRERCLWMIDLAKKMLENIPSK